MNNLKCYIVGDLLPLYIDNACSGETARDMQQHLQSCEKCRVLYEEMSRDLGEKIPMPQLEEKQLFRHAKKSLLGIMGALLVVLACLALNMGSAWEGGPAGAGHLLVTVFYILFWSLFLFVSRAYLPLVNLSAVVSFVTLVSAAVGAASVLNEDGSLLAALLSVISAVPFYGLRLFAGWRFVYGAAAILSLCWLVFAGVFQRRLLSMQAAQYVQGNLKMKKRLVLSAAFLVSLTPMLLNQYGGHKGVQEISGFINLLNPIGVISVCLFGIGVWGVFKREHRNRILYIAGTVGMVAAELWQFFTWHVMTITGKVSLQTSIRFAFPEFYIGLVVSLAMVAFACLIDHIVKNV